jgi:hypothetical protein
VPRPGPEPCSEAGSPSCASVPQTLLVVASVIVLAVFGLNRHRAVAADERAAIGREAETAALAVGEGYAGIVRDLAFDEADVNATGMRVLGDVTGLATVLGREAGESLADLTTLDDVDDLAGLDVTEGAAVASGFVTFRVTATAAYHVPGTWARSPGNARTTAKVVEVVVTEVTGIAAGKTQRPPVRVTLPVRVSSTLQYVHHN